MHSSRGMVEREKGGGSARVSEGSCLLLLSPFRTPLFLSFSLHPFFPSLGPFLPPGTGRWPDLVKHIRRSLHGLWTAWNAVHARENAVPEERDFYIEFRCTEREKERGDSGNGWLVMVVSRYVGIVKAGETSRLATRDERGEREERVKIPVAGVFSFSSFFLPSFLPSFLSFTLLPPCIISPLASRDRGFHVFQTAGLFAPRNGCRTRLCKLYEARACPRPRREPPSFEPYRTDWTESGSWIIHGGRSMEWFVLHRGTEERRRRAWTCFWRRRNRLWTDYFPSFLVSYAIFISIIIFSLSVIISKFISLLLDHLNN